MKRGELWVGVSTADYGGKPRPVVIVQADTMRQFDSVVGCPLTSIDIKVNAVRLQLEPEERTGLRQRSWVMIEKVIAYDRAKLSRRIGALTPSEMELIDATLMDLLGLRR